MFDEIEKVIGSNESCTMRLIHKRDIMYYLGCGLIKVFHRVFIPRLSLQMTKSNLR